jgi:hypothetical protein
MTDKYLWRKSSYSNPQANCVEVAHNIPAIVAVRDSKDPAGPVLRFTADEWARLVERVKSRLWRHGALEYKPMTGCRHG